MGSRGATKPRTQNPARHLRVVKAPPASSRSRSRAPRTAAQVNRRLMIVMLVATGALVAFGLVMVLSASSVSAYAEYGSSLTFAGRQAIYAVFGLIALIAASRVPFAAWRTIGFPFLAACAILLVLVLHPAIGTVSGGSARWIELGPVSLQPSEFVKLAVVACVAGVLARKWGKLDEPGQLLVPIVPMVGVICLLIMLQPDLGTTIIIVGTVFAIMFAAGVRLSYLAMGGLVAAALGTILIFSEHYRRVRFLSFLNPWKDPQNTGYQLIQGQLALASGGWTGVGLGASRQKWLYLPNAHTDFIFAIIGEELGLIGAFVVVALFVVLLWAGVRIAGRAPDVFSRLLAAGVVAWIGLQVVVNLGAVTGLLPITGVPLPLVSYGGSSLIVTLAGIGVLLSIARVGRGPSTAAGGRRAS